MFLIRHLARFHSGIWHKNIKKKFAPYCELFCRVFRLNVARQVGATAGSTFGELESAVADELFQVATGFPKSRDGHVAPFFRCEIEFKDTADG